MRNEKEIKELEKTLNEINKDIEYNRQLLIKGLQEMPIELFDYRTITYLLNDLIDHKKIVMNLLTSAKY